MSKKTDSIYKCLDNLDSYQQMMEKIIHSSNNVVLGDNTREIDDINFKCGQELKTLRFWIDSLYKYNGKSRSLSKKTASAANGRKGGRPPKEITMAKNRIYQLENQIIPELEHNAVMADSNEELAKNEINKKKALTELEQCKQQINLWKQKRG